MHIYLKTGLYISLQILRMDPLPLSRPGDLMLWLLNVLIPLENNGTVRNLMKIKLEDFLNANGPNIWVRNSRNTVLEGYHLGSMPLMMNNKMKKQCKTYFKKLLPKLSNKKHPYLWWEEFLSRSTRNAKNICVWQPLTDVHCLVVGLAGTSRCKENTTLPLWKWQVLHDYSF